MKKTKRNNKLKVFVHSVHMHNYIPTSIFSVFGTHTYNVHALFSPPTSLGRANPRSLSSFCNNHLSFTCTLPEKCRSCKTCSICSRVGTFNSFHKRPPLERTVNSVIRALQIDFPFSIKISSISPSLTILIIEAYISGSIHLKHHSVDNLLLWIHAFFLLLTLTSCPFSRPICHFLPLTLHVAVNYFGRILVASVC